MKLAHTDLQNLGSTNEDCFTAVMSINQRVREEETGNIKLNLLVIADQSNTNGQQLRMASGNLNGESWQRDGQHRRSCPSMGDYKLLQAEKITWEREKAALTERLEKMEEIGVKGNQVQGRNNLKKSNWEHMDYMNADKSTNIVN